MGVKMIKTKFIACILASGFGTRFGAFPPKQFQLLNNKPLYLYTLETVLTSEIFEKIVVLVRPQFKKQAVKETQELLKHNQTSIDVEIAEEERIENIKNFMFKKIKTEQPNTVVAFFDANRPFTPIELLFNLRDAALSFKAACPARPVIDGCCYIEGNNIKEIPDKEYLYSLQTPEFISIEYYEKCLSELDSKKTFKGIAELVVYSSNQIKFVKSDELSFILNKSAFSKVIKFKIEVLIYTIITVIKWIIHAH